jgi:hypothetical protein
MKHNERIALFVGVRSDMEDEHGGPVLSEVRFMQINDGYTFAIVETTRGEVEVHQCETFSTVEEAEFRFVEELMQAQHHDELIQITVAGEEPDMKRFTRRLLLELTEKISKDTGVPVPPSISDLLAQKPVTRETSDVDMGGTGYGMYL